MPRRPSKSITRKAYGMNFLEKTVAVKIPVSILVNVSGLCKS